MQKKRISNQTRRREFEPQKASSTEGEQKRNSKQEKPNATTAKKKKLEREAT